MTTMADVSTFHIRNQRIAQDEPLYIVAEIGLNHGGSPGRALALVDAAVKAGAAAVKLQTLHATTLVSPSCPPPAHVNVPSLQAFFEQFELDESAHVQVRQRAHEAGLAFISTPFDEPAVALLLRVGVDAIKIASGDLTHHRLIAAAARTGKPLILSTGMSELHEVEAAIRCARESGPSALALLHCVSAYPVPAGSENLAAIRTLANAFGLPVGLSDHGQDEWTVPLAVAQGASIYERHLVLDNDVDAIDAAVSSTGAGLRSAQIAAERARALLGHGRRECLPVEAANRIPSRRGVYAARRIRAGTRVGPDDIICLRPAHGIPAEHWSIVVGARAPHDIAEGTPLTAALLEDWS